MDSDTNRLIRRCFVCLALCFPWIARGQYIDSTYTTYDWVPPSVISAKSNILRVNGDTTSFYASPLMLHDGASLTDLLLEMPGLSIDQRGLVTIGGRPVRELLVEGKRYFGTDVASGLRSIPASLVGSVRAYEKDSDLGLVTGIDQADKEMVIDIAVKQNKKGRLNHSLRTAAGWQEKYDGKYNGSRISDRRILSVIAGSENLGSIQHSSGTSTRTGLGDNCGKKESEAGITFSRSTGKRDLNSSVLYKSSRKAPPFIGHSDYFRSSGYHGSETAGLTDERTQEITAQGTIEWIGKTRIMVKPLIAYSHSAETDSLKSDSFRDDSDTPYYSSLRHSDGSDESLRGGSSFIVSRRMSKSGRSLSANVDAFYFAENQSLRASTDGLFNIRGRVFSSWRDRESLLKTQGLDTKVQLIYSEPLARHHSLRLSAKCTWKSTFFSRDNTIYDDKVPVKDESQCADGRHGYLSGDVTMAYRYAVKRTNLTLGLSAIPVFSRFNAGGHASLRDTGSFRMYFCPQVVWSNSINQHNSLKLTYKGYSKSPSARQMLPVAANTNPVYIQNPNPALRPSFCQELNLTWKLSNEPGSKGFTLGTSFKYVNDDISTYVENNPESSGRIVTPVNVDGTLSAGIDLSSHISRGDFLFTGHFVADYGRKRMYIFDDVEKISLPGSIVTGLLRQTLVATYRVSKLELNALLEGELSDYRLDLRPDLNQRPRAVSAGAAATWQPGRGWTLSADVKDICRDGYAYGSLNRNYVIVNAKLSKNFFSGKLALQIDARDILRQWENVVCTMTSERRNIFIYEGNASYILGRVMINL